jgi:hypothetical protein
MSSIKDFELAQRIYIATHELKTRIAELERERDALKKDAERYRWLRLGWDDGSRSSIGYEDAYHDLWDLQTPELLDAAIDAARSKP